MAPLVKSKPPGGWTYCFTLKKIPYTVTGKTPMDLLVKVKTIHKNNEIEFCVDDFWFAVNLQWMPKVNPKFHLVPMSLVTGLASGSDQAPVPATEDRGWTRNAWKFIAIMLAHRDYKVTDLIMAVTMTSKMFDPKRNPDTGDKKDYGAALNALESLREKPPANRSDARVWFFQFQNSENRRLGKRTIRYQDYCAQNHWK